MPRTRNGPLVGRDTELVLRLAQGETSQEIAEAWGCSASTVSTRTGRVRDRLGARTNEQAVVEAYRRGLITLPGSRARHAIVRDRPGAVWFQHVCGEMEAFPLDSPPTDGNCVFCGSSSPHRVDWQPVWISERPQAVAS